jgi:1,4-alpha-glucan branching enzyme
VLSYARRADGQHVVVVMNMTPVPRHDYRIGLPDPGRYQEIFSTDDPEFGGSETPTKKLVDAESIPLHGRMQSAVLTLPPLGLLVLAPAK